MRLANPTVDPYAILGVPRTANAEQIGRAYRKAAQASHPDKGGSGKRMRELNAARKALAARAAEFADPALDAIKRLLAGKSLQDIMRIRDDIRRHIRSFEQCDMNGYGGPLNSPQLARHRRELDYLNHLLS
jgi:hypothetical protein